MKLFPQLTLSALVLSTTLMGTAIAGSAAQKAVPGAVAAGEALKPWEKLPATPQPVAGGKHAFANVNGVKLYYSEYGSGAPVILLHGGPANQEYFGLQVQALQKTHRVILVDTRGHGRSTLDSRPLGYDLFADDVVALMNQLKVRQADFLGWSDGGITALDIAMRYPERARRVIAFGANTKTDGTFSDADKKPAFGAFLQRAAEEYKTLSITPDGFENLNTQLGNMYATQPDWTDAQLKTIRAKVLILDGDHDEAIKPEHTRYIARTIPGAKLIFIPNTSHFAFLQDPSRFNAAVLNLSR